ncbi:hypothetical protein Tco_0409766 [Tanacetum coccineum]
MSVKHLWHIVTDIESLWVKWINTEKLKGRSFWEIGEDKNDNWGWRNILKQREDVRRFIVTKVEDGNKTSLWFDNWSNIGPLDQFISHRSKYDARINLQAVNLNVQAMDKIMWRKRDGSLCKFSVNQTYRDLINAADDVEWCKDSDSHYHLFFECEYSKAFWGKVLKKMEVDWNTYNWNDTVAGIARKFNGNSINSIIRRLCFAASVYLIWQERNNRTFRYETRSTEELFKMANTLILKSLVSLIEGIDAVRPWRGYIVECHLNDAFSLLVPILDCEVAAAILDKGSREREM